MNQPQKVWHKTTIDQQNLDKYKEELGRETHLSWPTCLKILTHGEEETKVYIRKQCTFL